MSIDLNQALEYAVALGKKAVLMPVLPSIGG